MDGTVLGINIAVSLSGEKTYYAVPYQAVAAQIAEWQTRLVVATPGSTPRLRPTPTPGPTASEFLPIGSGGKGESLVIRVEDTMRLQEIGYLGNDQAHYLVKPANGDNELVALKLTVHNRDASTVLIEVDEKAAEIRGFRVDEEYDLLDLTPDNTANVSVILEAHATEGLYSPFITGSILDPRDGKPGLPQGYSIIGWVVFEVPKGLLIREVKWTAGDTIYLRSGAKHP